MSYDRVRIRINQLPGGWLERRQAEELDLIEEFEITCCSLYTHGHHVVLVAGNNHGFEELFLFDNGTEAQEFFDQGFLDWDSFPDGAGEGCGFQEVSLFQCGYRIATKSSQPTRRAEVSHE